MDDTEEVMVVMPNKWSRNKYVGPVVGVFVLVIGLGLGLKLMQQKQEINIKADDQTFFSDSFEGDLTKSWPAFGSGRVVSATNIKLTGAKSLKITSVGSDIEGVSHDFGVDKQGTFGVRIYDDGTDKTRGAVMSVGNEKSTEFIIVGIPSSGNNYFYRIDSKTFDSTVPRSIGWHNFEMVVTPQGSYAKIDGFPLSFIGCADTSNCSDGVNYNLTTIRKFNLGRTWIGGDSYFDDAVAVTLFSVPKAYQDRFNNWTNKAYQTYGLTNVQPLIDSINARVADPNDINSMTGKTHQNTMAVRAVLGQAMMYSYRGEDSKAISLIETVISKYSYWGKAWLSPVAMNQLAYEMWWHWPKMSVQDRANFYSILSEEADFWMGVKNEVLNKPNLQTIAVEKGRRYQMNNSSLMTSGDYLTDTRAEETGATGQLFSQAYSMFGYVNSLFGSNSSSMEWNEAAKCFTFHTLTKAPGESDTSCPGIKTQTMTGDYLLGNHGLSPSPLYATAAINPLLQAKFNYVLAGLTVPTQFLHNIANKTASPGVWYKNIESCMDSHYNILSACHKGQDWGDANARVETFVLPFWADLDGDIAAKGKLESMLETYYFLFKDSLRYPKLNAVAKVDATNGELTPMVGNMESHVQVSLKNFTLEHYSDSAWRVQHFPMNPMVCEENIFRQMVWTGSGFTWGCPADIKHDGANSLYEASANYVDAELYSPLIRVTPGLTYKLKYWVKANGIQVDPINPATVYGTIIPAQFNNLTLESSVINDTTRVDPGWSYKVNYLNGDWAYREVTVIVKKETQFVRLRAFLGGSGRAKGEVWFDNVAWEKQ